MVKKVEQMLQGIARKYCGHKTIPLNVQPILSKMDRLMYAKQLLDNPLWNQLLTELKQEALNQCEVSPARDVEGREFFWKYIKSIEQLKGKVASCLWEEAIREKREENTPAL